MKTVESLRIAVNQFTAPNTSFDWFAVVKALKRCVAEKIEVDPAITNFIRLWESSVAATRPSFERDPIEYREIERMVTKAFMEIFADNKVMGFMLGNRVEKCIDPRLFVKALAMSLNFRKPSMFLYEVGNLVARGWTQANTAAWIIGENTYLEAAAALLAKYNDPSQCDMSKHVIERTGNFFNTLSWSLLELPPKAATEDKEEDQTIGKHFSRIDVCLLPTQPFHSSLVHLKEGEEREITWSFNRGQSNAEYFAELVRVENGYCATLWSRSVTFHDGPSETYTQYQVNHSVLRALFHSVLATEGFSLPFSAMTFSGDLTEREFIPATEINPETGCFYFD